MNEYIFDKRKLKKFAKKYLIMFACLFPLLLIINGLLMGVVANKLRVVLLVIIASILVTTCEIIILKVKQNKQQQDVVVVKAGTVSKKPKKYVNKTKNTTNKTDKTN